jgi:hypothetical protein
MKRCFIVLFVLFALNGNSQSGYSPEQMQVLMKMRELKNALIEKDSVGLSTVLSGDVTYGHTNGIIQTKAQLIRSVMSGEQDYKTIEPSNMEVRMYGNTGVATMNSKVVMNYQDKPLEINMFITMVWIRSDTEWKLVARQSVKL